MEVTGPKPPPGCSVQVVPPPDIVADGMPVMPGTLPGALNSCSLRGVACVLAEAAPVVPLDATTMKL